MTHANDDLHATSDDLRDDVPKTAQQVAIDLRQSFAARGFDVGTYDDDEIIAAVSLCVGEEPTNYFAAAFDRLQNHNNGSAHNTNHQSPRRRRAS